MARSTAGIVRWKTLSVEKLSLPIGHGSRHRSIHGTLRQCQLLLSARIPDASGTLSCAREEVIDRREAPKERAMELALRDHERNERETLQSKWGLKTLLAKPEFYT